jgi:hypothetical protein
MRDVAEDSNYKVGLMRAYLNIGLVLKNIQEYRLALIVFKKMLQIAWYE